MKKRAGFTMVEVIVAIVVFGIGVLALASSSSVVVRMMTRGQSSEIGTNFGGTRIERLRLTGCTSQAAGADTLFRGANTWVAINNWTFTDGGGSTWRIAVSTRYKTAKGQERTETQGTTISCRI
jgi:prepilin-type N-terminal cleavage/methylation domain-containing protein